MNTSIITIGDEILIGQVVDTNSAWIAQRLSDTGARICGKYTVGDSAGEITSALERALKESDAVIITGGLGPTKDDITKKTLAAWFGMEMHEDSQVLADVREMLSRRGIDINSLNRGQAMVPDGCRVLRNKNGTAPGMWFEYNGKAVISLPGVPFEMKALLSEQVLPQLVERFGRGNAVHRTVHTSGIAESLLAERLTDWENSLPGGIKLAYLPSPGGVRLRLSSLDMEAARAEKIIGDKFAELETVIGPYLLGEGNDDTAASVARLLTASGKTLSVAESCTGGRICGMLTRTAGASDYLSGGVVAYSVELKVNLLGIPRDSIDKYGVVSEQTALAMAEGVRMLTGSDYALSTTGYAGPGDGPDGQPVGTVWIGVAYPGGGYARKFRFGKLRDINIERAADSALNLLRLHLIGDKGTGMAGQVYD